MEVYENLDLEDIDGEIWKQIKDYPDYKISSLGRVKSFIKWNGTDVRILNPHKSEKDNRLFVCLYKNIRRKIGK